MATPRTVARQAPLSMGFSLREYWSGLPFPSPGGSNGLHEVPMQTLESSLNLTLSASFFDTVASLATSHLPLLLHRIVFCLLWRNEWSEILNWKKCSRHTFDSLGPHGSYLLRADDKPDHAFVMSLVLPMTPRDGAWKFISQRRRLKMLRGCSRSHTY